MSPHANKRQKMDDIWTNVWNHVTDALPQSIQELFQSPNFGYLTPISSTKTEQIEQTDDVENTFTSPAVFGLRGGPVSRLGWNKSADRKSLVHLIDKEAMCLADPEYMQTRQMGHFKQSRRSELLHFMKNICKDFLFLDETYFISVAYLDIYLSKIKVTQRKQFNLLALSCVFLASKIYEEILEPTCTEMTNLAVDGHTLKDLKRMERKVILALDWNFNIVTPHVLLQSKSRLYSMRFLSLLELVITLISLKRLIHLVSI